MTREEQVKICRCCSHHKFDMQKGIVCGITGEPANFEKNCSKFESNNQVLKADDERNGKIQGFLAFYVFWSIPLGIVLTLIRSFAAFDSSSYVASSFLLAYDIIFTAVYIITCIYVILAFVRRYSDAVFMAKYQLLMLLFSNLFVILLGETEIMSFTGIIWSVIFFIYLTMSEDVKDRIPKDKRRLTRFNKLFVPLSLIIPLVCLLIGIIETFNGHSLLADPKEKIEDMCEVASSTLPDGDLYSIYVDENSVIYGYDMEWGELSKTTIDRLGITLRESILSDFEMDISTKEFFNLCIDADFDVVYRYMDREVGTCVNVVLSPEHLSQITQQGYEHSIKHETWNEILDYYNSELPRMYFQDCYLENVSVNTIQNRVRYDLKLTNISAEDINALSYEDFKSHMLSILDSVSDDIFTLIEYCNYDVEYSFTADCLSWWSKSVVIEGDELFK